MSDEVIAKRDGLAGKEATPRPAHLAMLGRKIGRNLRIKALIGEGGMGAVYLAENETLPDKRCAVKVLSKSLTDDPIFRERFFDEAKRHARLEHANIVRVYDFFEEGGEYFLVMAYVDGQSLSKIIEEKGKLSEEEAVPIFQALLRALDYVHRQGIVHRDVKTSNVLVDHTGQVLLTDFGISIRAGDPRLTGTQVAIGTTFYMSPEQIIRPSEIDHRSDVYSAGVVLFEMLTGHVPFEGETDFVIKEKHLKAPPPDPCRLNRAVSRPMARIILKALEKNPDKRFQGCADFLSAFARPPASPWPARLLALALALGGASYVGYQFITAQPPPPPPPPPDSPPDSLALSTALKTTAQTYALLCREKGELELKQRTKQLALKIPDMAAAELAQKQIEAKEKNMAEQASQYGALLEELSHYDDAMLKRVAEENSIPERTVYFTRILQDYQQFKGGKQSVSVEQMVMACPK
jgi:serine/threonine protein kinase